MFVRDWNPSSSRATRLAALALALAGCGSDPQSDDQGLETSCEAIKSGAIVDIDMVYGCNEPPIG